MSKFSNSQQSSTQGYPEYIPEYSSPYRMEEENPINWKKYFFLFIKNWYWFLITIGLALGIAFFINRYTIPLYQASATLIIEEDENTQDIMSQFRAIRYVQRRADMGNEVAKLRSFSLAKRTVDSIDQNIFWTAHGRIRERPLYKNPLLDLNLIGDSITWYKNSSWFISIIDNEEFQFYQEEGIDTILSFNDINNIDGWKFCVTLKPVDRGHNTYSFIVNDLNELAKTYRSKIVAETDEKEGTLITIRSIGPVGEREMDYINALCHSYIASGLERKQQIAENTFVFIDNQIKVITDSLQQSESQLLTFRLTNNVINLSREGEIAFERLKSLHEQKTQLQLKANYYNYLQDYVETRNDPQTIISPTLTDANDQLLVITVNNLQLLYEERENLDFSASSNNPGVKNLNTRIASTRIRILEIIDGLKDNNVLTMNQVNIEENAVLEQLKSLPINEQQLLNIRRKYDLYNQFYTFLLQKRAEAGIQKASTISNARVLDHARSDNIIPVGNNKKLTIIIALLASVFFPVSVIFLWDLLDTQIRERDDISTKTDIPILGIIGHSFEGGAPNKESPNSPFTESLRRIRANLQFLLRQNDQNVIMVTSTVSGEGKTFTATNLATIIAMNNRKVLLIGCDLRKPALHKIFGVRNKSGLSSVIIGENDVDDCILKTSFANLDLLPSGPVPPNPAELLETEMAKQLFNNLKLKYDYLILDTPPVALVSDSLSLSEYADLTIYVIRQNFSKKDVMDVVNQLKNENRLPKIGLVINDIKPSRSMGYNYYYGYNRGYNYGYFEYSSYDSSD